MLDKTSLTTLTSGFLYLDFLEMVTYLAVTYEILSARGQTESVRCILQKGDMEHSKSNQLHMPRRMD
jgi:hypothetical protein